jgi:hypothetical protein
MDVLDLRVRSILPATVIDPRRDDAKDAAIRRWSVSVALHGSCQTEANRTAELDTNEQLDALLEPLETKSGHRASILRPLAPRPSTPR